MTRSSALFLLAGGTLVVLGLRRGSAAGAAIALAGGYLAYRGWQAGQAADPARPWLPLGPDAEHLLAAVGPGVNAGVYDDVAQQAKEARHPAGTLIEDIVEESSDDSFPASDPPSYTAR